MQKLEKYLGILILLLAIGFNLWLYRAEPTALVDPNDNNFQFALVERTNQIWDFAQKECSNVFCRVAYLADHWVPNWAEGYNLPYYYSHLPQIFVVASWRLISHWISLFTYYHLLIYLLLCLFPLSVFLALRLIGLSWLTSGFGALISTHFSTDGLYGLDQSSYLWRGWGLSSQLYAMIFLPLTIAYAWKVFRSNNKQNLLLAILFLAATASGHLGIGLLAFISVAVLALPDFWHNAKKVIFLCGGAGLLLGYWLIPAYLGDNFHNFSLWDPIWKFNSYGAIDVLKNLFNGNLFDFGRFPILTILIFIGLFYGRGFSLLFIFWLLMYFGRSTWGGLLDLVPGLKEFHQSRFIVGVHLSGLFLIPLVFEKIRLNFIKIIMVVVVVFLVFPQTLRYAQHNDFLIRRANVNYQQISADLKDLFSQLRSYQTTNPGRVYAGRGANWGKDFYLSETPMYIYLSNFFPGILWLPETWSPNSDTEQFFSDDRLEDYELYNIKYVVTPARHASAGVAGGPINLSAADIRPFWQLLAGGNTWRLYEVPSTGYFTTGIRPAIVSSSKYDYLNVVRLWIQSDYPKQRLYPELTFSKNYPVNFGLPNFRMLDEVNYQIPGLPAQAGGSIHNLFSEIPVYQNPEDNLIKITSQSQDSDMIFRTTVEVKDNCPNCILVLKQTFHPSWQVKVNGKKSSTFIVFPFYTAVALEQPGTYEVVFSYSPSLLKIFLLVISLVVIIMIVGKVILDKTRRNLSN